MIFERYLSCFYLPTAKITEIYHPSWLEDFRVLFWLIPLPNRSLCMKCNQATKWLAAPEVPINLNQVLHSVWLAYSRLSTKISRVAHYIYTSIHPEVQVPSKGEQAGPSSKKRKMAWSSPCQECGGSWWMWEKGGAEDNPGRHWDPEKMVELACYKWRGGCSAGE